jgi:hypothetical protein
MKTRWVLRWSVRTALVSLALIVGAWSSWIWRTPSLAHAYDDVVWQVTAGEVFSAGDLDRLAQPCSGVATRPLPRAALLNALVAVRHVENAVLQADLPELSSRVQCAGSAVRALLESNPASSLGWFLLAWVSRLEGGDSERPSTYLERSVELAPRELWMAVRRRPLMEVELLRGRFDLVRSDYRTLAVGERPVEAASLLSACVSRDPLCEMEWNAGLTSRQVGLVWRERVRGQ